MTDACLDWEKQGDDIAVIEPLVTLLAAWGDDLILRSMIPWQSFYIR